MRYFLLILIWCYSLYSFGSDQDSVRTYYELKNKAEMYIIDSNYMGSLALYKKAFMYKKPNVLDLYNVFILSYILKDTAYSKATFNQMALHGFKKERFDRYPFIASIKDQSAYQWVSGQYDSLYAIAATNKMAAYARVMDSILNADQQVRKFKHPTQEQMLAIIRTDTNNLAFLKAYIDRNGFPGYEGTGTLEEIQEGLINASSTLWLLLWHSRHISKMLNETLRTAVLNGNFNPDEYALIIDMQETESVYYNVLPRKIDKDKHTIFLPVPNIKAVDQKRALLYLDKVDNYKRKLLYNDIEGNIFRLVPEWAAQCNFAPIDLRTWQ